MDQIVVRRVRPEQYQRAVELAGIALPVEQTRAWAKLDSITEDREVGAYFVARRKAETVAVLYATKLKSSGVQYLWARSGPVWVEEPTAEQEDELLAALRKTVKKEFPLAAFLRLHTRVGARDTRPIISTITFDSTVVIDLEGDDEELLGKFKARGRRDVRKALRESTLEIDCETDEVIEDFSPYYEVMLETAKRDGFFPPKKEYFEHFLSCLGREHALLAAAREDGKLVAWSLLTMSDGGAQRFYAATNEAGLAQRANDLMVYKEALFLRDRGCKKYDLMGIGSDLSPTLMGLNEFKTKFSEEVTHVRPARDLALHRPVTALLELRRDVRDKLARYRAPEPTRETKFMPVIIGGGIEAYALARQFNDEFDTRVVCISKAPSQAVALSDFIDWVVPEDASTPEGVLAVLREVAAKYSDKKLVLMTNADAMIDNVVTIREELPEAYACAFPSRETLDAVSDKASFKQICEQVGIDTARYVEVKAGEPFTEDLTFPVVAKPALSAEFDELEMENKHKVYYFDTRPELQEFLGELEKHGYKGAFVVEEYIPGGDSQIRSVTAYVDTKGNLVMLSHAQVALQDHRPSLVGNPVAMLTSPNEKIFEKVKKFFEKVDYQGFANFDIKVDPRDGTEYFLEVNPRIGRNSGYVFAAGINPMRVLVNDVVFGNGAKLKLAPTNAFYTLVPSSVARKWTDDPELAKKMEELEAKGLMYNPLKNEKESQWKRDAYLALRDVRFHRIFRQYPPAKL
ncbi:MAG: peptidoglycan bridge formation glycyltransferase FemA/FemB family protein [Actinomycetaceae bacterium]|nr:peptidoglycan bridge formation glycyltransferase FemA/FemB family protein [Actinomycetaceae bacterium]